MSLDRSPSPSKAPVLVWLRQDLRLADHPALSAAAARGVPVIPVYVWAPAEDGEWAPGGASRWWLHRSLASLDSQLRALGSRLILRHGSSTEVLRSLARETGAGTVFTSRRYEPAARAHDLEVAEALRADGVACEESGAALLHEPTAIRNRSGGPFQVFTPFWRACLASPEPGPPLPVPGILRAPRIWPKSTPLAEFGFEPRVDWASGLRATWRPGESGAAQQLQRFLAEGLADYTHQRDHPDVIGTSRLSPHLHFGEISPRQIWHALRRQAGTGSPATTDWRQSQFVTELGWREFAYHLLWHFPQTPQAPLRVEFAKFPWRRHPDWLKAWQRGQTGYPLVDAGMRELWATGWMHNRVRMVVASFLVKHLLISWTEGARWFWDTLVDADLASNTLGWQWSAGCGADAAPYFRIFNPLIQGTKFDAEGHYVRRWVPELACLPAAWIHQPWAAPEPLRKAAGVVLGRDYPEPMVAHVVAREVALEAYARTRAQAGPASPQRSSSA
jgi:deoxyribodipyrimidine photo-lyase